VANWSLGANVGTTTLNIPSFTRAAVAGVDVFYTLDQIKHSERTLLLAEIGYAPNGDYWEASILPRYAKGALSNPYLFNLWHTYSGSRPDGCSISFVDGHAIFWTYVADVRIESWPAIPMGLSPNSSIAPDLMQLVAWNGLGEVPPGVTP
jgi:hypothetical protein